MIRALLCLLGLHDWMITSLPTRQGFWLPGERCRCCPKKRFTPGSR